MTEKSVAKKPEKITDKVMVKLNDMEKKGKITFPPNYSVENALQSAWLILQEAKDKNKRPVLEVCTRPSIANALFDMAIQGLNPAKKQCYPIAYGSKLTMTPSYFGVQAVLRRIGYYVDAQVIYQGDTIEIETHDGRDFVTKHVSPFENRDNDIQGAYGVVKDLEKNEIVWTEVMTMAKIKKSWGRSKTYGKGDTPHTEFPDQMAKRTVIVRASKNYVNSRDDKDLLIQTFKKTLEADYKDDEEAEYQDVEIDTDEARAIGDSHTEPEAPEAQPEEDSPAEPKYGSDTADIFHERSK